MSLHSIVIMLCVGTMGSGDVWIIRTQFLILMLLKIDDYQLPCTR